MASRFVFVWEVLNRLFNLRVGDQFVLPVPPGADEKEIEGIAFTRLGGDTFQIQMPDSMKEDSNESN